MTDEKPVNAGKNRKPGTFVPGDPRINRKGRPRTFQAFRNLMQSKANEVATDISGKPIVKKIGDKEHIMTNAEVFVEMWMKSKNGHKDFAEFAWGKPRDEDEKTVSEGRHLVIPADLIGPDYFASHRAIHSGKYNEFVEDGGRGSLKSSFISTEIVELLVNHPTWHALATRQVKDTLRDSVYAQFVWAIGPFGLNIAESFKCTTSPLEIEYLPTGQKIYFRGADDPGKIKSIKPPFGHIAILWFEELDSFRGPETVRNIEQSAIRGGDEAFIFKSFNPPRTANNWANKYIKTLGEKTWHHSSNYLSAPVEWLGKAFIDRAEYLKEVNPLAYEHEYLGVVNGLGGMVFDNVVSRPIKDEEIAQFDRIGQGLDWGYYPDPLAWGRSHYDAARHTLYIFDEYRAVRMGNEAVYKELLDKGRINGELIIADSAEPKSVGDFRAYGANIRAAEKGPDSVSYSIKWLQSLKEIVIDPQRCPYHLEEFINYEYEQDKDGNYISEYPDKNNHFIDATRYRTNLIWRTRGQ